MTYRKNQKSIRSEDIGFDMNSSVKNLRATAMAGTGTDRPYRVRIDPTSFSIEEGESVSIVGQIENQTSEPLMLGIGSRALCVGARLRADSVANDTVILCESRGDTNVNMVSPGASVRFTIRMPTDNIPFGRYRIDIDLVKEHQYWAAERGLCDSVTAELTVASGLQSALARCDWVSVDLSLKERDRRSRTNRSFKHLRNALDGIGAAVDLQRIDPRTLASCWDLFMALRGHLFEERRFRTACAMLSGLAKAESLATLSEIRRADVLVTLAIGLMSDGLSADETRAILWAVEDWTATEDSLLDFIACLVDGRFDGYRKISAGADIDAPPGWGAVCDLLCCLRTFEHNDALVAARSCVGVLEPEFLARVDFLIYSGHGDYSAAVAAFSGIDICEPPSSAFEILAINIEPRFAGVAIARIMLDLALDVGDDGMVTRLSHDFERADYLFGLQEFDLTVASAKGRWSEAARLLRAQLNLKRDDGDLWRKVYGAAFRSGDIRAAMDTALEAMLEPSQQAHRDEFNWFRRSASAALAHRDRSQPSGHRLVWDITALFNVIRDRSPLGGIEKVTANVIRSALTLPAAGPQILVNWREFGHKPVHVSAEDFERVSFGGVRELLALNRYCVPEEKFYVPRDGDVVIVLGSQWHYDSHGIGNQYYKDHGAKTCILIHDLLPIFYAEIHPERWRIIFERWVTRALQSADLVLANSTFTMQQVIAFAADRVALQAEPRVVRLADKISFDQAASDLDRHTISLATSWNDVGYVLIVASQSRRKNHVKLLTAWALLKERLGDDCPCLVMVGPPGDASSDIASYLAGSSVSTKVLALDYVTPEDLERLYRQCLFTVLPSACEGWGMPVAEAFQHAKVVVTLRNTALQEVGGELAIYAASDDPGDLLTAIEALVVDKEARELQEVRITNRYETVDWNRTAREIVDAVAALNPAGTATWASSRGDDHGAGSAPIVVNRGPSRRIVFLCPSWGQQCGIAQYTDYAVISLRRLGIDAEVVTTCEMLEAKCRSGAFDAYFVQHEYGLFDRENAVLSGPDSSERLAAAMRLIAAQVRPVPGGVIFHTVNLIVPRFARRTKLIMAATRTNYILHRTGAIQLDCRFLEHGIFHLDEPRDGRVRREPGRVTLGTFGFLSQHKVPWKIVDACRRTEARLVALFSGGSDRERNMLLGLANDAGVEARVDFGYASEEEIVRKLQACDILYMPQEQVNYFATSGSVRLAMNVGIPILVSPVSQFTDLGDAVIRTRHTDVVSAVAGLLDEAAYGQAVSAVGRFRDANEIGHIYAAEVGRLCKTIG